MRPEKNQEVLLTTLRHLRVARVDVHLVIAGDGPLRDFLARRAAELEVADRVSFVGELDDVRPVLTALDVFVLAVDGGRVILQRGARGHGHRPSGHPE